MLNLNSVEKAENTLFRDIWIAVAIAVIAMILFCLATWNSSAPLARVQYQGAMICAAPVVCAAIKNIRIILTIIINLLF